VTDVLTQADRDVCAREAAAAIEAILDRRCPEMKIAFWAAVGLHYRLDPKPDAAPRKSLDGAPPAPPALVLP
jgi:hypothetical protein